MHARRLLILSSAILFATSPRITSAIDDSFVPRDKPIKILPKNPNYWLLSLGVNKFEDRDLKNLNYCENDATDIVKILTGPKGAFLPEHTYLLTSLKDKHLASSGVHHRAPTARAFMECLEFILDHVNESSVVLIFISSHGIAKPIEKRQQNHSLEAPTRSMSEWLLAAHDSNIQSPESWIAFTKITRLFRDKVLYSRIIIVDACQTGAPPETPIQVQGKDTYPIETSAVTSPAYNALALHMPFHVESDVILASCSLGQESFEFPQDQSLNDDDTLVPPPTTNGLFSHYVLLGLQGFAAGNDSTVMASHLDSFIKDNVHASLAARPYVQEPWSHITAKGSAQVPLCKADTRAARQRILQAIRKMIRNGDFLSAHEAFKKTWYVVISQDLVTRNKIDRELRDAWEAAIDKAIDVDRDAVYAEKLLRDYEDAYKGNEGPLPKIIRRKIDALFECNNLRHDIQLQIDRRAGTTLVKNLRDYERICTRDDFWKEANAALEKIREENKSRVLVLAQARAGDEIIPLHQLESTLIQRLANGNAPLQFVTGNFSSSEEDSKVRDAALQRNTPALSDAVITQCGYVLILNIDIQHIGPQSHHGIRSQRYECNFIPMVLNAKTRQLRTGQIIRKGFGITRSGSPEAGAQDAIDRILDARGQHTLNSLTSSIESALNQVIEQERN